MAKYSQRDKGRSSHVALMENHSGFHQVFMNSLMPKNINIMVVQKTVAAILILLSCLLSKLHLYTCHLKMSPFLFINCSLCS